MGMNNIDCIPRDQSNQGKDRNRIEPLFHPDRFDRYPLCASEALQLAIRPEGKNDMMTPLGQAFDLGQHAKLLASQLKRRLGLEDIQLHPTASRVRSQSLAYFTNV